ncbi:MAG: antitoxin [Spirochaetaceae bacterium]|nr:MAG: antitoxin [Spirochaetaceae bacterium]
MLRDRSSYNRLITELGADIEMLQSVLATNRRAQDRITAGSNDELDYAALAYTIHNIYGVIEGYCLRVAKFYENGLDGEAWHSDLLRRMTLSIPKLRPALLDKDLWYLLDDLRAFRHKFRHLYARPLEAQRVMLVQQQVETAVEGFVAAHITFQETLKLIYEQLPSDQ